MKLLMNIESNFLNISPQNENYFFKIVYYSDHLSLRNHSSLGVMNRTIELKI